MNGNEHIAGEDLALFALLSLSPEEAAPIRAHVAGCPLCAAELGLIRRDLASYALASTLISEPAAIPNGARGRFLKQLGREKRPARAMETAPNRGRTARLLAWTGWAAAAAAIVVALGLRQDRDALQNALRAENGETSRYQTEAAKAQSILGTLTSPASVRVTLSIPKAPTTPSARATYGASTGTLLLQASNLRPLPAGKVYEMWIIPADGGAPVAAGTFSPDARGNASLLAPAIPGATAAKAFGITAEPAGGSPGPTLPILLVGAVS